MRIRTLADLLENGFSEEEKHQYLLTSNKQRVTKGLFWEHSYDYPDRRDNAIFTLRDSRPQHYQMKEGVPRYDMRQLYMGLSDHTEFEFIEKFMYDVTQWEKLIKSPVFTDHITKWRDDLRLKVKSEMYEVLRQDALDPDSKSKTQSAKYLIEKFYDPKKSGPVKKQTKKEKEADLTVLVNEDLSRIKEGFKH